MMVHVFPTGRMCTLRRALLLWLVPVFLLVGAASACFSYWSYSRMVGAFMDDQMELLATSIAASDRPMPLPALTRDRVHHGGNYVVQVYGGNGLQASSWPELKAGPQQQTGLSDIIQDGTPWRVYATSPNAASGHRVQVFQSEIFRRHVAAERAGSAIAPVLILLPIAVFVLWGVVAAVSAALRDIAQQAAAQDENSIAELSLVRVPEEIKPMVISFNSLLTRLRDAFAAQRRFVQDAAHELRTPIAAIGLQLENLRGDLAGGPAAQRFAQLEAGVVRAQRLVDQLLRLSRQEAGSAADAPAAVDLQAQLHESVNTLIALADQRNIDLGLDAPDARNARLMVKGTGGDVRSLLDNLIENALRYTPEGGVVDIRLLNEGGRAAVEVVDTGPGIPPELLARVFDRFFRVPGTGARGSGLGLSIARAAALRCGMRLTLRNREDRSGLIARIEPA